MTQTNAQRLADAIERYNAGVMSQAIMEDYCNAASELRRLDAENAQLRSELEAVRRDEREQCARICDSSSRTPGDCADEIRSRKDEE